MPTIGFLLFCHRQKIRGLGKAKTPVFFNRGTLPVLLLVTVLPQTLFTLVGGHLMTLALFSARHRDLSICVK